MDENRTPALLAPCPCGEDAAWYKVGTSPEEAPEHAVCLLTDDDFADNYCQACFPRNVPEPERGRWRRADNGDALDAPVPA